MAKRMIWLTGITVLLVIMGGWKSFTNTTNTAASLIQGVYQDGEVYHTVRYGENLTWIAAYYGTSVDELIRLNNLPNPNYIYVGQRLLIRQGGSAPAPTPGPGGETQHTVQYGDTVFGLAQRYGVAPQAIIQRNNLQPPYYFIYVGQVLVIPTGGGTTPPPTPNPPPPGGETQHTVRPGDTVFGIARQYNVPAQSIIDRNNLRPPYIIYVGQILIIPTGGTTPAPTPTPAPPPPGSTPTPIPPTSGMGWGIQGQYFNQNWVAVNKAVDDMNLQWLKQQIRWSDFEASPGTIEWGPMDDIVEGAGTHPLLFSVLAAPGWARPAGFDPSVVGPPADPATYASFVGQLAGRYCGKVQAIEVWNEQNLAYEWGNQDLIAGDYINLLAAAHGAIKDACPGTLVISGALTPTGAPPPAAVDDFTYMQQMYNAGLKNYVDGVGVHPSGFNIPPNLYFTQACAYIQQTNAVFRGPCDTPHHSWTFRSTLEGTRNVMVQNGHSNAKLWITEFGWAVGGNNPPEGYGYAQDNTRDEQAQWTSIAFSLARDSGYVGGMFLWNLNFEVVAPGSEQALWSVYGADYAPTVTVPAVRDTPH